MYYLYEHICGHDSRVFSFLLTAAYSLLGCVGPLMDVYMSIGLSLFMFAFRNTLISPTLTFSFSDGTGVQMSVSFHYEFQLSPS